MACHLFPFPFVHHQPRARLFFSQERSASTSLELNRGNENSELRRLLRPNTRHISILWLIIPSRSQLIIIHVEISIMIGNSWSWNAFFFGFLFHIFLDSSINFLGITGQVLPAVTNDFLFQELLIHLLRGYPTQNRNCWSLKVLHGCCWRICYWALDRFFC